MRLTSNLRMRCGFLFAVLIVLASNGAIGSPASAAEPAAKVFIVSGQLAAALESQNKPVQPVLRARAGEHFVVILFAADPQRAAALPGELFSTDPVENCYGGVTCCDPTKGVMVVNATYNGQNGWVQTGELCEPKGIEVVGVDEAPPSVSFELNSSYGITSCLMEIPDIDGNPRLLVNGFVEECLGEEEGEGHSDAERALPIMARAPAQGGALWLTSLITRRAMPQATSPTILASHCPSQKPAACPGTETTTKLCRPENDYWYKKTDHGWCKISPCSGC